MRRDSLIVGLLLAATFGVYWSVGTHEFINYDDTLYLTENPQVRAGLTWRGVVWAFSRLTSEEGNYWHPITWLSHMLDCQLFGLHAGPHHLVSLAFHAANVALVYLVLRVMTGFPLRSAMVAALFALHPLQVDTVAWAAERKNVLSTFFWLLTLLAYVRYTRKPAVGRYLLVVLLFALGLMSKPMLVTLPCVLLLLDYWPLRRVNRSWAAGDSGIVGIEASTKASPAWLLVEKLPLFALALAAGVITIIAHYRLRLITTTAQLPLSGRFSFSMVSYIAYLNKAIWPVRLAVFYPMPKFAGFGVVLEAGFILTVITTATLVWARNKAYLLVGWFWFLGTLVPVIGILQVSQQAMADRWAYVPLIGLFIMAVWGCSELFGGSRLGKTLLAVMAAVTLVGSAARTHDQLRYWQDSETLFRHALAVTDNNHVAHLNLGAALVAKGELSEGAEQFDAMLKLQPNSEIGHFNRGSVYALTGKPDQAIEEYKVALRLNPNYPRAQCNWGNVLALQKKYDEAATHYQEAIRLDTNCAEAYGDLGNVAFLEGDTPKAQGLFEKAVGMNPALPEIQYLLAGLLAREKRFEEAVSHYREVLKYTKKDASAMNDLAWILATEDNAKIHNAVEATQLARRACELTNFGDPGYLDTLAAAYSETGRFPEAIETTRKAVAAARAGGKTQLATRIESRLKFYEAHTSYRAMIKSLADSGAKQP